eukprot:jgi/Ulvmu1/12334/UM089_0018.1
MQHPNSPSLPQKAASATWPAIHLGHPWRMMAPKHVQKQHRHLDSQDTTRSHPPRPCHPLTTPQPAPGADHLGAPRLLPDISHTASQGPQHHASHWTAAQADVTGTSCARALHVSMCLCVHATSLTSNTHLLPSRRPCRPAAAAHTAPSCPTPLHMPDQLHCGQGAAASAPRRACKRRATSSQYTCSGHDASA